MGGVLEYKWEPYCDTNGRSTDKISLSSECRGTKSTAVQIGGVLQYKLDVYCNTFLRSSGGWGFWRSSEFMQFSLGNEGKDGRNLSSQTWLGSPRRPSPRHPRPLERSISEAVVATVKTFQKKRLIRQEQLYELRFELCLSSNWLNPANLALC